MTQTTWAVPADVVSLTGQTVIQTQVDPANGLIEIHGGKVYTLAVAQTGSRDLEWMKRAVAYQTVWMISQPDVFSRLDLEAIAASGRPVPISGTALTLSPLSKRALQRVSWLKSRSLHVRSPFQDGLGPLSSDPLADANDYYLPWQAM
jgi:hypothetical protein